MVWNPQQYLKFSGHRLRPAVDLLMRIPDFPVRTVADLGAGAGNVTKLIKERWPEAFEYWADDVASRGTPGGETAFQVAARAMRVVEGIRSRQERGNVLLVSHKATLRVITCALLGLDVRLFRERIAYPVGAVTVFVATKQTAQLTILGDRSHLPEELKNQEGT